MSEWRETMRGVVFPWHCDHFGHMNVRWYSHFFDDAGFQLWTVAGCSQSFMRETGAHVVVAQNSINYLHELRAGDLLVVRSAFTRLGNRSVTHVSRMYNADSGQLNATLESVEVFFDMKARKSSPMPDAIRTVLSPLIVAPDSD